MNHSAPPEVTPMLVESPEVLEGLVADWRQSPALAVDTEFVRERTFYPGLGLIQVSDGQRHALVDPLAVDIEPLREILTAPEIVKVFHSCGEDLEVLFHRYQIFPQSIFDTQIAAALTGFGPSIAYGALIDRLFGVEVPKGETRSNWLRRPLSPEQLRYAALDVAYLLPAFERLQAALKELGRESWLREEVELLTDTERFLPDPETVYRSFARWTMSRRELAVLRAISSWRERRARKRDLPRNFVLPKASLVDLARQLPRSSRELAAVKGLRGVDRKRHGAVLVELIADALDSKPEDWPAKRRRPVDLTPHRGRVKHFRQLIAEAGERLGIPAELLASRKTAESVMRRLITARESAWPSSMTQWRREILGELIREDPDLGQEFGGAL